MATGKSSAPIKRKKKIELDGPVTNSVILKLWWPLAASWLLMSIELPALSAVIARMDDPKIHLAAYGSLVFPISLLIEAPIIMMLAASTALARDIVSYNKIWRFMMSAGATLTAIHLFVAFSPLFDIIARDIIGAPEQIIEPARLGFMLMAPWSWSIAYRRFNQGVLIRFGYSSAVGVGTSVRLVANFSALAFGYYVAEWSGIVVATAAVSCGVVAEAIYAGRRVRPVVREHLEGQDTQERPINRRSFLSFYIPLALTPLMTLVIQPMGATAMSRMPDAMMSLAAWSPTYGFLFLLRCLGLSFNEVVVTLIDNKNGAYALRRFARVLALVVMVILIVAALTPLSTLWFGIVSGLEPDMVTVCSTALLFSLITPGYAVMQNLYQGTLVNARKTREITEAVAIYLVLSTTLLAVGIGFFEVRGIYYVLGSFMFAGSLQTGWLWYRSRPVLKKHLEA